MCEVERELYVSCVSVYSSVIADGASRAGVGRRTFPDGHKGRKAGREGSPFRVVVYDPEDNTFSNNQHSVLGVVDNPPVDESVVLSKSVGVETAHIGRS